MNNQKEIQRKAIVKANTMFNPSYNRHTEELTGEPSDREAYDYAGCDKEVWSEILKEELENK